MNIKIVPAYDYPQEVGTLFSEYTNMLIAGDSSFQKYLDIQHYDEEVTSGNQIWRSLWKAVFSLL